MNLTTMIPPQPMPTSTKSLLVSHPLGRRASDRHPESCDCWGDDGCLPVDRLTLGERELGAMLLRKIAGDSGDPGGVLRRMADKLER